MVLIRIPNPRPLHQVLQYCIQHRTQAQMHVRRLLYLQQQQRSQMSSLLLGVSTAGLGCWAWLLGLAVLHWCCCGAAPPCCTEPTSPRWLLHSSKTACQANAKRSPPSHTHTLLSLTHTVCILTKSMGVRGHDLCWFQVSSTGQTPHPRLL